MFTEHSCCYGANVNKLSSYFDMMAGLIYIRIVELLINKNFFLINDILIMNIRSNIELVYIYNIIIFKYTIL